MKQVLALLSILLTSIFVYAQEQEVVVPHTLADRDRMIRIESRLDVLETRMDAIETKMDVKFDGVENKFDGI